MTRGRKVSVRRTHDYRSYEPVGGWMPLPRDRALRAKGEHTTLALLLAMVAVTHPAPQWHSAARFLPGGLARARMTRGARGDGGGRSMAELPCTPAPESVAVTSASRGTTELRTPPSPPRHATSENQSSHATMRLRAATGITPPTPQPCNNGWLRLRAATAFQLALSRWDLLSVGIYRPRSPTANGTCAA